MSAITPKLQILNRDKQQGDGKHTTEMVVFCPKLQYKLPIDQCAGCEHCEGFLFDQTGRDSFLRCNYQAAEIPIDELPAVQRRPPEITVPNATVGDIMESDVVCATESQTLEEVTSIFIERGISGVPVVDAEGKPVGMVSKTDLLRRQYEQPDAENVEPLIVRTEGAYYVELGRGFNLDRIRHEKVADVMTPIVVTATAGMSLAYAAGLMTAAGVHRLVVLSEQGDVVGVLSSMKVLRWLAESQGYIRPVQGDVE